MVSLSLILAAQAATGQAPVPPVERLCLLAGPSRTLVAMRVVPDGETYLLRRVDGQTWPFSTDAVRLGSVPQRRVFEARDEAANLFVSYQLFFAAEGGVGLEITRGVDMLEGLPLLYGSCAEPSTVAAAEYLRQARDPTLADSHVAEDFRTRPLVASRNCQVVSAAGWVSRFAFEFAQDSDEVTIHAADRHLWHSASLTLMRGGMPPLPIPKWVRFAFYLSPRESVPEGINSFWVHATPNGSQGSMRASFFGYDPEGPITNEDVSGVCAVFAEA